MGVGSGGGVNLNNVSSQSTRGRRATTQRHSPASAAMQMPHTGLSAAAVQALANGWSLPGTLTQAQTQQVLRLAQVCFSFFKASKTLKIFDIQIPELSKYIFLTSFKSKVFHRNFIAAT